MTHTSDIPCPSPKMIGWLISHLSGLIKKSLNKNRKLSSNIPAVNAIKIPMSKGFAIAASVKSGFWFNFSKSGKRNKGCEMIKQRNPSTK